MAAEVRVLRTERKPMPDTMEAGTVITFEVKLRFTIEVPIWVGGDVDDADVVKEARKSLHFVTLQLLEATKGWVETSG